MTVLLRPGRDLSCAALAAPDDAHSPWRSAVRSRRKFPSFKLSLNGRMTSILVIARWLVFWLRVGQENDGVGGEGSRFVVLGTGVNVHARPEDLSAELRARATSLATAAPRFACSREAVGHQLPASPGCSPPGDRERLWVCYLVRFPPAVGLLGRDVVWNSRERGTFRSCARARFRRPTSRPSS